MMCFWAANCFCAREAGISDGVVLFDDSTCDDSALRADGRTIVRPYKKTAAFARYRSQPRGLKPLSKGQHLRRG